MASCTTYAYVEGWRNEYPLIVRNMTFAYANGWGRVDCTSADIVLTDIFVQVFVDPGAANTDYNTCSAASCGAAASVDVGFGEVSQNCYQTIAEAAANGVGLPAAQALICG